MNASCTLSTASLFECDCKCVITKLTLITAWHRQLPAGLSYKLFLTLLMFLALLVSAECCGDLCESAGCCWHLCESAEFRRNLCRSVRTRRFQTLSTQDLAQFLIVGVLSGLFWLQRAKSDTTAAASDTLGGFPSPEHSIVLCCMSCQLVHLFSFG